MTAEVEQLPLIPAVPLRLGALEMVPLDRLPPDEELLGDPPVPALIDSVRRWGVLEPLLVRAVGGQLNYGDVAQLIAGRRRLKAARIVERAAREVLRRVSAEHPDTILTDETAPGYRALYERFKEAQRVPVRVVSDPEGLAGDGRTDVLALTTNAVRRPNPATDYVAIVRLLAYFAQAGKTEPQALVEIAKTTGLAVGTIKQRLRLQHLSQPLAKAFLANTLGYSAALEASRLSRGVQLEIEGLLDAGKPVTVRGIRDVRRALARQQRITLFDNLTPAQLRALGGTGEAPILTVRAQDVRDLLRSTRLPVCVEAAGVIDELLLAREAALSELEELVAKGGLNDRSN